ncbi:hypothetical protein RJ639_004664 [Escallonia herrerae]|uniref:rRNA biogenesis protein RRP5 n=1 Tax=Escallonia herrerae TaxID=1293975 RepID=A0AA88W4W0_9ASTE|nr:hypothetical protein RJ639_004664 [Escallonia herrerae]
MAKKFQSKKSGDKPTKFLHKTSNKPFKPKAKQNGAAPSKPLIPPQLEDDIPDFPRGGGRALSREEFDEVRAEVDAEFDLEEREASRRRKRGKTGTVQQRMSWVHCLNMSPGMKLWGVIAEVNEKDIVVSLPGGIRGLVRASEAVDQFSDDVIGDVESTFLSSMYQVGQLVSCVVLQLDDDKKEKGKRKLWLSMRLSLLHKGFSVDVIQEGRVLSAYVKSIEDHGYMLHFGLPSFTGFMPRNSHSGSRDFDVNIGQLLQGVVKNVDKTRKVVYLSYDPVMVSKCVTKDLKGISIDLLVPGMMVNARVRSTLENGVMLSFLTYFTGTVDMFHLQKTLPTSNWKDDYSQNKKDLRLCDEQLGYHTKVLLVNARILFIDPSTRAVGLTLNPHLVQNKAPPLLVKTGDIFDHSKVVRVDRGMGLLLEVPSLPIPTPAYVNVSDVADKEVRKLEKSFKEGSQIRVRVLGFRHLEGLATGLVKTSAFEGSVFTHSDVKPGMVVKAKVIAVDSFGAIVQLASGVKALCPLRHMSEFEIVKPRKKFQVGIELVFRVLGCKSKRITVTHKKTLVKSKLPILSSYADATEGLITHGWITKIEKHGCFVRFCNGVQGFAPRKFLFDRSVASLFPSEFFVPLCNYNTDSLSLSLSRFELGLDPGCETSSMYHVEQVIKCRITSSVPASRRINLSFVMTPASFNFEGLALRGVSEDMVKPGILVSGVVERITSHAIIVDVSAKGYTKGTIYPEHLSDNQGLAALMKSVLKPGYEFDQLLVLDVESSSLILTAKYSLINSAQQLPLDVSQVRPHSVLHGYVCNLIETGCFVRFIGRLTGFAPKNKATDDRKADLSEVFYTGQSVRCNVLDVSSETDRITLSLKQSLCSSMDASFIQEYFLLEEKIAKLQLLDSNGSGLKWVDDFGIGGVIEGIVHEAKDVGVVISYPKYNDIFGFVAHYQLGGITVEAGSKVRAAVLDIARMERLVDLSLKPEFVHRSTEGDSSVQTHKKKRKGEAHRDLEVHQSVNAIVEIVKDNYLVLSIPECNYALGYASVTDYNTQRSRPKKFVNGQCVIATIVALPGPSTSGRLLLLLKSTSEVTESSSSKRLKKKSSYNVGSLVHGEITEIKPLEMRLKFGPGFHGRVHITETDFDSAVEEPFNNFRIGQTLAARILSKANKSGKDKKFCQWELSIKSSMVTGSSEEGDKPINEDFKFVTGQHVTGFVYKVDKEWVWLTVSRDVRAQLYVLDSACEPNELQEFQKRFLVGKALSGYILSINKEKKLLRLVLHPLIAVPDRELGEDLSRTLNGPTSHIAEGQTLGGRISKVLPGVGGLLVQIDPHLYGKVHFTELTDIWMPNPLSKYHEGQFVKCKVLEISRSIKGTIHIDLSLRSSSNGKQEHRPAELGDNAHSSSQPVKKIEDLHPDMVVQGYVKNVTPKGCFIMLSRKLDAKILLSKLSEGYVENPEQEFPIGKLVIGKVVSVEPLSKRVEVSLRTSSASKAAKYDISKMSSLRVGDIISGTIKRVELYGLFITVEHSNLVGLCHVSELSEDPIDDIEARYRAGEKVAAKILKVDEDRHRISLGMKSSYLAGDHTDDETPQIRKFDDAIEDSDIVAGNDLTLLPQTSSAGLTNVDVHYENQKHSVLAEAESRASIPPLEVSLDDVENSAMDITVTEDVKNTEITDTIEEKTKRRAMKKAKEQREKEIKAAEERLLEKDIPRTADEFEKLVRSSPNSSFVWIKYMAFMLSLADVEKARSIAERALRTINIREETEKLNIWVAYFNLENEYGNPPEEAVVNLFKRALQYCDPKKVHLALLGMYERTEQYKLAVELLDKMVKKFKHSRKVWLRRIQTILKHNQGGVQSLVSRALLSLPRKKHIKFISQTAVLEFKCGVPDRGRSMFEGMLREYPKRTDLWSIYLDQEIRIGDVDVIRALFERAISLSLPPKKMKGASLPEKLRVGGPKCNYNFVSDSIRSSTNEINFVGSGSARGSCIMTALRCSCISECAFWLKPVLSAFEAT